MDRSKEKKKKGMRKKYWTWVDFPQKQVSHAKNIIVLFRRGSLAYSWIHAY